MSRRKAAQAAPPEAPALSAPAPQPKLAVFVIALVIAIVAALPYAGALSGEFLNYDDNLNFTENPDYRGLGAEQVTWMFTTFHVGHYQPITWLTLGWDYVVADALYADSVPEGAEPGMVATPYRFTNLVFHGLNAALFFLVALKLITWGRDESTARTWPALAAAAFTALFFAIHPMRVESVAWITERRDLVSGFFLFLTTLTYLVAVQRGGGSRPALAFLILAHVFLLLGMMSKVILITLPPVLLVLDWKPLNRIALNDMKTWVRPVAEKTLMFAMSFVFGYVVTKFDAEEGWLVTFDAHPLPDRIGQMFFAFVFYVGNTFIPALVLPMYEMVTPLNAWGESNYNGYVMDGNAFMMAALLVIASLIGLSVWAWRHEWGRRALAGAIIYIGVLIPVSGLVQTGTQLVAARYSYLAVLPVAVLLGGLAYWLLGRFRGARPLFAVVAFLWLASMTFLTAPYAAVWRTSEELWGYTVQRTLETNAYPSSFAYNNFGQTLLQEGEFEQAADLFRRAVDITASNIEAIQNYADATNAQVSGVQREAQAAESQGMTDRAAQLRERAELLQADARNAYEQAIRIAIEEINRPEALRPATYYNLGLIHLRARENERALELFNQAIVLRPDYGIAHANRGLVLQRMEDGDRAAEAYREAIRVDPSLLPPRMNLAVLLDFNDQREEAIALAREALRINPNYTRARRFLEERNALP